jgi:hypothetical protein
MINIQVQKKLMNHVNVKLVIIVLLEVGQQDKKNVKLVTIVLKAQQVK